MEQSLRIVCESYTGNYCCSLSSCLDFSLNNPTKNCWIFAFFTCRSSITLPLLSYSVSCSCQEYIFCIYHSIWCFIRGSLHTQGFTSDQSQKVVTRIALSPIWFLLLLLLCCLIPTITISYTAPTLLLFPPIIILVMILLTGSDTNKSTFLKVQGIGKLVS